MVRISALTHRPFVKYGLATALVLGAVALRLSLLPLVPDSPFLLTYPTVVLIALFFGTGAGVWAAVLSVVAVELVLPPDSVVTDIVRGSTLLLLAGIVGRLAEKLRAENALLDGLLDNLDEGIIITGGPPNYPIRRMSRRGLEMAMRPTELDGAQAVPGAHASAFDVFLPDGETRPEPEALPIFRATRGERVENMELVIHTPDGRRLPVLASTAPVRDARGKIVAVVGAWRDISDRKRTEEAVRAADRRKDEFLALLGHELRNPLAPIRNAVHVLRRRRYDETSARRLYEMIERQVSQMTRLVDDLLDVSRIARGKVSIERRDVDLGGLLEHLVDDHRDLAAANGLELHLQLPEERVLAYGDPVRLAQAVGNLLHNAQKFTDRGGRIDVSLSATADTAEIHVRDTGVGMTKETLALVFEPFAQGARTRGHGQGGLGLGLALVQGWIGLHGGEVTAHSDGPGQGAELVIRLPRLHPPSRETPSDAGRRTTSEPSVISSAELRPDE